MPSDQEPTAEQISQVKTSILEKLEKEPPAGKAKAIKSIAFINV